MLRSAVSTLVLAFATFAPVVSHGSMFHSDVATVAKGKMVKVLLKNRTSAPMDLMIEDKPVTIAANGEYELKAVEGTHVYGADKVVKVLITRDLNGTTCSFR